MLVRIWAVVLCWVRQSKEAKTALPFRSAPAIEPVLTVEVQADAGQPSPRSMSMQEVGNGNIQVGYAGGQVVSQVSHHSHNHNHSHAHNHTHSHVTVVQTSAQAPANEPQVRKPSSAEQSATLRRMNQLNMDKRIRVLNFMESKFGTRMVIELKAEQLNLLNRYLEPVMKDTRNLKDARPARAA